MNVEFAQLLEGEPDTLVNRTAHLSRQAQAIADAAQTLNELASGQIAKSATELRSRSAEVQTAMLQAQQRYESTASALKTYGVQLGPIKTQASVDIPALEAAQGRAGTAEYAAGDAQRRQLFEKFTNSPPDVQQDTADDLARAQRQAQAARAEVEAILRRLRAAQEEKERIAQAAMNAIESVISQGADSFFDNVAQFFEGVGDFFATIGKWIAEVVDNIIKAIDLLWRSLIIKIFAALVLGLVALLAGAVFALVGLVLFGPMAVIPSFLLGAGLVGLVTLTLVSRMLTDVLGPDAEVTEKEVLDAPESTLDTVFDEAALVDSLNDVEGGPDDAGTIRIEWILGEDGIRRARITLPSTQDWQAMAKFMSEEDLQTIQQLLTDAGASNDVDSNLALMLMPEFQTIYERAVIEAMTQAGIEPGPNGTPVMLVGFSQGGIMAAHLAANRQDMFNFDVVMAAGSPIDHLTDVTPPGTQVYSIQHEGDPVPLTDGLIGQGIGELFGWMNGQRDTPTWDSIHATAVDENGNEVVGSSAHDAELYNDSWADYLESGALTPEQRAELELYFSEGNERISVHDYTWSENDQQQTPPPPPPTGGTSNGDDGGGGGDDADSVRRHSEATR